MFPPGKRFRLLLLMAHRKESSLCGYTRLQSLYHCCPLMFNACYPILITACCPLLLFPVFTVPYYCSLSLLSLITVSCPYCPLLLFPVLTVPYYCFLSLLSLITPCPFPLSLPTAFTQVTACSLLLSHALITFCF